MLNTPTTERGQGVLRRDRERVGRAGRVLHLVHLMSRLIRNLAVSELIIGGDCWDRGQRGDKVVDYLRKQPNVSFIWGNHDISWLGACLGNDALMCTVLQVFDALSADRADRRGLQHPDDAAGASGRDGLQGRSGEIFLPQARRPAADGTGRAHAQGDRDHAVQARRAIDRAQPAMESRSSPAAAPHRSRQAGTIEIDGATYPMRDTFLPTVDPNDPYALSPEEQDTLKRLRYSFQTSQKLYEHMQYLAGISAMYLVRDDQPDLSRLRARATRTASSCPCRSDGQ